MSARAPGTVGQDEAGLYLELEDGRFARPAGPSRFSKGERLPYRKFASGVCAVGKSEAAAGKWAEAWIPGHAPEEIFEAARKDTGDATPREYWVRHFFALAGSFLEANPGFDPLAPWQRAPGKLAGPELGFMGVQALRQRQEELGRRSAQRAAAMREAAALSAAGADGQAQAEALRPASRRRRI